MARYIPEMKLSILQSAKCGYNAQIYNPYVCYVLHPSSLAGIIHNLASEEDGLIDGPWENGIALPPSVT